LGSRSREVRAQLLSRGFRRGGVDQDEGEDGWCRAVVDPCVHRAALDDDIARHFEPINGPNVKPDDAIGSVEWHYSNAEGIKITNHPIYR